MDIKVDIVLGFLGSGKTTLINFFLQSGEIENELVVIVLFGYGKKEIVEKSKDIIIIHRKKSDTFDERLLNFILSEYRPDRIVIEYNGVEETDRFINTFKKKSIRKVFKLDKVINVINSRQAELYFRNANKKISRHIKNSQIVILNNLLGMDKENITHIKEHINKLNESVRIVEFIDEDIEEELINNRRFCLNTENEKLDNKELLRLIVIIFPLIIVILSLLSLEEMI